MVSMFKYSKVATYSVSLTPKKLEFDNSIRGGVLKKEFETVSILNSISDVGNGVHLFQFVLI